MTRKSLEEQRHDVTVDEIPQALKTLIRAWYEHDGRPIDWIAHEIWLRVGVSKRNARALAEQIAFETLKRRGKHDKS